MLHIVLYQPEIPENTGNISRMCVGMNVILHLIRPYGFFLTNKKLIRSGVDYWDKLILQEHDSYQKFYKSLKSPFQIFYITKFGKQNPSDFKYQFKQNTYFVFGKESSGLPRKILDQNENHTIRIPSSNNVRSLNLSNCVAIMSYEYTRQTKFESLNKKW